MIFTDNHSLERLEVIESEVIEWRSWRKLTDAYESVRMIVRVRAEEAISKPPDISASPENTPEKRVRARIQFM